MVRSTVQSANLAGHDMMAGFHLGAARVTDYADMLTEARQIATPPYGQGR